ncbi:MAG: flippase [Fibrobacteres bacterium]|nr:flippase [Fibrobacterota bacterium]
MTTKSLKLNVLVSLLRSATTFLFPLVTFPYSTRVLGPEGIGKLNFALSFVSYFTVIAAIGIPMYGIRAIAQARSNRDRLTETAQELFLMQLAATLVTFLAFLAIVAFSPKLQDERLLFWVVSTTIVFGSMSLDWLYQGLEDYVYIAARGILINLVGLVGLLLLVKSPQDYVINAAITVFATLGSGLFNVYHVRHIFLAKRTRPFEWKRHFKPMGYSYLLALIVAVYSRLDVVMLGFLSSVVSVAYYTTALKITRILLSMVNTMGGVLMPRLSYYISNGLKDEFDRMLTKSLGLVMFITLPMVAGLSMLSKEIILLFAGEQYLPALWATVVTTPLLILSGLSTVLGLQILYPLGKDWMIVLSAAIGAAACCLASFLLIPTLHHLGSAIAITAAEFCVTTAQLIMVGRVYRIRWPFASIAKCLTGTLLMSIAIFFARNGLPESVLIRLIVLVPMGGAVYAGTLYLLKENFLFEVMGMAKKKLKLA